MTATNWTLNNFGGTILIPTDQYHTILKAVDNKPTFLRGVTELRRQIKKYDLFGSGQREIEAYFQRGCLCVFVRYIPVGENIKIEIGILTVHLNPYDAGRLSNKSEIRVTYNQRDRGTATNPIRFTRNGITRSGKISFRPAVDKNIRTYMRRVFKNYVGVLTYAECERLNFDHWTNHVDELCRCFIPELLPHCQWGINEDGEMVVSSRMVEITSQLPMSDDTDMIGLGVEQLLDRAYRSPMVLDGLLAGRRPQTFAFTPEVLDVLGETGFAWSWTVDDRIFIHDETEAVLVRVGASQ